MNDLALLSVLAINLENIELVLLSKLCTSIKQGLVQVAKSQYFWFLRTQYRAGMLLQQRLNADWRQACIAIESVEQCENKFFEPVLRSKIATEVMLDLGYDPSMCNNYAIRHTSCYGGCSEVIRLLLADERVDSTEDDSFSIRHAAITGNVGAMRALLEDGRADPEAKNNQAIRRASFRGDCEAVMLLLMDKRVDPSCKNNYCICTAAKNGHVRVMKLLLDDERVDPNARGGQPLILACEEGNLEVARLLCADIRVQHYHEQAKILKTSNEDSSLLSIELEQDTIK